MNNLPKVLLVDVETFPNLYYAWRLWEGRALDIKEFSSIVCFSAKWLDGKHITMGLSDVNWNEAKLIKALWKLVDEADILVAHNGRAFDFGRMNSQFLKHGLPPPSPTQKVDTKKVASQVFGFDSNSLDNLCQFLGIGEKMETGGYDLWRQCINRNKTAWAKMRKYNAHDIVLLEKLYLRLRPWMPNHPNLTLYTGGGCPKCGGTRVQSRGSYKSETREYDRYQCQAPNCMGWLKGTTSIRKTKFNSTNG